MKLQDANQPTRAGGLARVLLATRSLRRQPAKGVAVALALYLAAFTIRLLLGTLGLKSPLPFATFAPVVVVAPLVGGLAGGLIVVALSGVSAWYFFLPPHWSFALDGSSTIVLVTYVIASLLIVAIVHGLDVEFERLIAERQRSDELFRELQHRIANNLQTVSTILRLQEREIGSAEQGRAALREAGARLATLAAVHRRLYDPTRQNVDLTDHLNDLCRDIVAGVGSARARFEVEVEQRMELAAERVLLLSLIVNEVVVNALKHAFPEGAEGTIQVRLERDGPDVKLSVGDDGVGRAGGDDGAGLGTRIVEALSQQLGGRAEWRFGAGTQFVLRFPAT